MGGQNTAQKMYSRIAGMSHRSYDKSVQEVYYTPEGEHGPSATDDHINPSVPASAPEQCPGASASIVPPRVSRIPPRRVALCGGGVRGIAHAGVMRALRDAGFLAHVKEVIGISAGSLFALLWALEYSVEQIEQLSLAFDFTYNLIFGNFNGIIPSSLKQGKVVSMKWFRYAMTVLMPPFGVFLNKGIYGWFNILVCMLLTYINYLLGIVYAIVITMRNRYADQYEDKQIEIAMANNPPEQVKADLDALVGFLVFIIILFGSIGFMLHQF